MTQISKMSGTVSFKMRLLRLQPSETWTKESGSEDELTFVLVKAGAGTYQHPSANHRLVAGNVLFFCGRAGGKLSAAPKSDCVFSTFSMLLEHVYPIFSSNEVALLEQVLASFRATKFYPSNSAVALECAALADIPESQSMLVQRSQLLRIVAIILAEEFKAVQSQRSGQNWPEDHMIQIFEKLSSADLLNLSVDDLAAKFNCSRRHLNRLFHQHFNLSITALRMEIRLLKAVSLLRNSQAKVINVAEQCGFNHLGLFNTCFKRRFGMSPGQWRNSSANEREAKALAGARSMPAPAAGLPVREGSLPAVTPLDQKEAAAAALVASLAEPKIREAEGVPLAAKGRHPNPSAQLRHDG